MIGKSNNFGCILQSSYKKQPIRLPGNKYKKINTKLAM